MKPTLLVLLLLLLSTPAFAITITTLDLNATDDTAIEIAAPVWDGAKSGAVLIGAFESKFDRKVANKLAGGFRNAMMPSYDLAASLDFGKLFAETLRAEGTKLGLTMMAQQEARAPQWTIDGTIHGVNVDVQHMGYGSLLFYTYLDVEVRVTQQDAQAVVTHRIRPARLFVMYNGGMGIGDEVQAALAKIVVVGAQQILARLNREHFHAPALSTMETRLAGLKQIDDRGESELHAIGLSGVRGASAALASRLESERDENARTSIVYALTSLGAEEQVPLLIRRFASEDDDVRYATIIALANAGTPEALALIREKGTKDKTTIVRKLSERVLRGQ
ncbi:MAG TPA: HEAT repeat domain-containing protein [Thermoanaerobaculia bacterium]|nr:HEAT repeat domain-containing protein [Thermoanaerobaculia bacterium]